jgi:competence protein ComEA
MHYPDPTISPPAPASASAAPKAPASVIEPRGAGVVAGRWRVWAPIAMRAVALAIALVGLAGIGAVVSQASPPPSPPVARAGLELGALSDRALAALGAGGIGSAPASVVPPNLSTPSLSPPAPSPPSLPAPAPCPPASSGFDSSTPVGAPSTSPGGASSELRAAADERPVVLNRADASELRRLPGIGAKRAEAILALRQRLGRFRKPTDLLRVKGIGPRTLERMLPHLVLD